MKKLNDGFDQERKQALDFIKAAGQRRIGDPALKKAIESEKPSNSPKEVQKPAEENEAPEMYENAVDEVEIIPDSE